jgi:hypothetical protein
MSRASATMDFQLIASWLGLPAGPWPPDHYTLLGLQPGETDTCRIEQAVHERLMRVRSYQLTHPVVATEAMMRLAKAFDCLTNPMAKKAYDKAHFPNLVAPALPPSRIPTALASDTTETKPVSPVPPTPKWWNEPPLDWKPAVAPPPVRNPGDSGPVVPPPVRLPQPGPQPKEDAAVPPIRAPRATPEDSAQATAVAEMSLPTPAPVGVDIPTPRPSALPPSSADSHPALPTLATGRLAVDPLLESIRNSTGVRRGIEYRRGLYRRVRWLRRLVRAWERMGKYVHRPKRRLSKLAEETDLTRLLLSLEDLLQEAPAVLGEPGQPGYRVLALATQEPVIERFKALSDHDRALLARDWVAGRELLAAYRRFLREQVVAQRHLTGLQHLRCRIDALLTEHLVLVLGSLGLAAVLILAGVYFWPR